MQTISDILKQEREKKNLSLQDVINATKIKRNFLVAIESADFKVLPSESYALGFIKNYAQFLGIPEDKAAALFRREYKTAKIEIMPKFRKSGISGRKIFLRSPKGYLILMVAFVVLSYIAYQFSFLFIGPKLNIISPKAGAQINSSIVNVTGKTDPYATVKVNNQEVYVDLTGSFKKTLYVYTGETKIKISAKNRYGKETRREIAVTVQ